MPERASTNFSRWLASILSAYAAINGSDSFLRESSAIASAWSHALLARRQSIN